MIISDKYISYINAFEKNVFSAKGNDRNHTRKYLGIVYSINGYNYYISLSSPNNSDYRMENGIRKIRGSISHMNLIKSKWIYSRFWKGTNFWHIRHAPFKQCEKHQIGYFGLANNSYYKRQCKREDMKPRTATLRERIDKTQLSWIPRRSQRRQRYR